MSQPITGPATRAPATQVQPGAGQDPAAAARSALFSAVTGQQGDFTSPAEQRRGHEALFEALGIKDDRRAQQATLRQLQTPQGIQRVSQQLAERFQAAGVQVQRNPQTGQFDFAGARQELTQRLGTQLNPTGGHEESERIRGFSLGEALKTGAAQQRLAAQRGPENGGLFGLFGRSQPDPSQRMAASLDRGGRGVSLRG